MDIPAIIEHEGNRVLTTAQLAECYEIDSKVISKNFTNNRAECVEGIHFYVVTGDDLKAVRKIYSLPKSTSKLYLWTESGALFHAKAINKEKVWFVYGFLIENYFHKQEYSGSVDRINAEANLLNAKAAYFDAQTRRMEILVNHPHLLDYHDSDVADILKKKALKIKTETEGW